MLACWRFRLKNQDLPTPLYSLCRTANVCFIQRCLKVVPQLCYYRAPKAIAGWRGTSYSGSAQTDSVIFAYALQYYCTQGATASLMLCAKRELHLLSQRQQISPENLPSTASSTSCFPMATGLANCAGVLLPALHRGSAEELQIM